MPRRTLNERFGKFYHVAPLSWVRPLIPVRLRKKIKNSLARVNPCPLISIGNQRSGTTAIAGLLAEALQFSASLDIGPFPSKWPTRIRNGELTFAELVQSNRERFSADIVKEPGFTFVFQQCRAYFPDSPIVFIVRDPRDNIRSMLDLLKLPGNLRELEQQYLESIHAGWRAKIDGTELGCKRGQYVEIQAERWNEAVDVYLKDPEGFFLIRYEDFVKHKVEAIVGLAQRLGLHVTHDIASRTETQYNHRGSHRDVPWGEFFRAENLGRIEKICGPRMKRFGYELSQTGRSCFSPVGHASA
jgi:hypothetical protein